VDDQALGGRAAALELDAQFFHGLALNSPWLEIVNRAVFAKDFDGAAVEEGAQIEFAVFFVVGCEPGIGERLIGDIVSDPVPRRIGRC
jgi:hypothetical protein